MPPVTRSDLLHHSYTSCSIALPPALVSAGSNSTSVPSFLLTPSGLEVRDHPLELALMCSDYLFFNPLPRFISLLKFFLTNLVKHLLSSLDLAWCLLSTCSWKLPPCPQRLLCSHPSPSTFLFGPRTCFFSSPAILDNHTQLFLPRNLDSLYPKLYSMFFL